MRLTNIRYINEIGGILADYADEEGSRYFGPEDEGYDDLIKQERITPFSPPEKSRVSKEWEVVEKRDKLLLATDWSQLADIPEATRLLWQPYRQALRDIPQQAGYPDNVIWPTQPAYVRRSIEERREV